MTDYNQHSDAPFSFEAEVRDLYLSDIPQSRPARDGINWVKGAISLIKERWGTWILIGLIFSIINMIISKLIDATQDTIFLFGILVILGSWIMFCLMGGLNLSVASLAEDDDLSASYLFSGFQYKLGALSKLFASQLLITLVLIAIGIGLFLLITDNSIAIGIDLLLLITGNSINPLNVLPLVSIIAVLYLVFLSLTWHALPLVALHDVPTFRAFKMSFLASLKNILPALVSLLVLMLIVAALGFIVGIWSVVIENSIVTIIISLLLSIFFIFLLIPFSVALLYVSYRNIWTNLPIES